MLLQKYDSLLLIILCIICNMFFLILLIYHIWLSHFLVKIIALKRLILSLCHIHCKTKYWYLLSFTLFIAPSAYCQIQSAIDLAAIFLLICCKNGSVFYFKINWASFDICKANNWLNIHNMAEWNEAQISWSLRISDH